MQEVARVRNRKQEIISQDDLYTLAGEYIKGTTTATHLELCVCLCEEEENIRQFYGLNPKNRVIACFLNFSPSLTPAVSPCRNTSHPEGITTFR